MSDHTPQSLTDQQYLRILSLYQKTLNPLMGMKMPHEDLECFEGLTARLYFHAASIYTLSKGTIGPEHNFIDPISPTVLCRSLIESYARFYRIFFNSQNDDQFKFRVYYHRYQGLKLRQDYETDTPSVITVQKQEAPHIAKLEELIRDTRTYQSLNRDDRKQVVKGRYDKPSKALLIHDAMSAVSEQRIRSIYAYLSDAAHAGYVSVMQAVQLNNMEAQKAQAESTRSTAGLVLVMAVLALMEKYPQVAAEIDGDKSSRDFIREVVELVRN